MSRSAAYILSGMLMTVCMICCFIGTSGAYIVCGMCVGVWISIWVFLLCADEKEEKAKKKEELNKLRKGE